MKMDIRKLVARTSPLLVLVVILLSLECGLRFLLFSEISFVKDISHNLRKPSLYADYFNQDDFWKLRYHFGSEFSPPAPEKVDLRLGWVRPQISLGAYTHEDAPKIGSRTPILLYGDSFADQCFEDIFEESVLRDKFALINYGVGGYGLDQIYLLLKESIDHYADLHPVVIVSLFDRDMDRSILAFREGQKPLLKNQGDRLVLEKPVSRDLNEYLQNNPIGIRSYIYRYIVYGTSIVPEGLRRKLKHEVRIRNEKKELNRLIFRNIRDELTKRGLDYFFLLFLCQGDIGRPARTNWRERFIIDTFRELTIPFISSKTALQRDATANNRQYEEYFLQEGVGRGHLNYLGYQVIFKEISRGLNNGYESYDYTRCNYSMTRQIDEKILRGEHAAARYGIGLSHPIGRFGDGDYLFIHPGREGPTEVHFDLGKRFASFVFYTKVGPLGQSRNDPKKAGLVGLTVEVDGEVVSRSRIGKNEPVSENTVDLRDKGSMRIIVDDGGNGIACDHLYLLNPQLH